MAVFSTGMASLVGVPVYVMLAKKFDTRWLMMIGLASFGLSMWSFSFITHEWGAAELFLPQILRGFPQVFAVAPSVNLGLGSLPPERLKYASGLFNMMRNLGGAVGIAVCGAILNNRTNFHFQAIASNLTPANGAMNRLVDEVAQRYAAIPGSQQAGYSGGAQAALGAHLPRGLDAGLRRRLSRHHGLLHLCDDAGSLPAQRRPREGPGAGRALKPGLGDRILFVACGIDGAKAGFDAALFCLSPIERAPRSFAIRASRRSRARQSRSPSSPRSRVRAQGFR